MDKKNICESCGTPFYIENGKIVHLDKHAGFNCDYFNKRL